MAVALHLGVLAAAQRGSAVVLHLGGTGGGAGAVRRPLRCAVAARWQHGQEARAALSWTGSAGRGVARATALAWRPAVAVDVGCAAPWGAAARAGAAITSNQAPAWGVGRPVTAPWRGAHPRASRATADWGVATERARGALAPWGPGRRARLGVRADWSRPLEVSLPVLVPMLRPALAVRDVVLPWQQGRPVWGRGAPWAIVEVVVPPPTPCWVPPAGDAVVLRLATAEAPRSPLVLWLRCRRVLPTATVVVPVRRVYVSLNQFSAVRVRDGVPVPLRSMRAALDADSWAWTWSGELPASALPLVVRGGDGALTELQITLNGWPLRVLCENLSRSRSFGSSSLTVSGRSPHALLGAPSAAEVAWLSTAAMTTQQLADDALPPGWTLDWGLTPWLVPTGLWSHVGTPITALTRLAAVGGGYVRPDATARLLAVLPRYPLPPWEWAGATPDLELPSSAAAAEAIEWTDKPAYNAVLVSGTAAGGVQGVAVRAGTAGDQRAQDVSDALICHVDAVRQRALPVLADTGAQAAVTLGMQVPESLGVVLPGKLVRYVDGGTTRIGLSRSVSASYDGQRARQSIVLETHA